MIVLRNHPALKSVLSLMTLNKGLRREVDHEMNERVWAASQAIFGVGREDTDIEDPDWIPDAPLEEWPAEIAQRFDAYYEEWERPFAEYLDMKGSERTAFLRANGWDVSGEDGAPLECLSFFLPQILHIIAGRGGKTVEQIDADTWAASMKPVKPSSPTPAQTELNRKMLALANPRPRAANDHNRPRVTRPTKWTG